MRDLRDLLSEAAGSPPDLPDVDRIRRRARPRIIGRRAVSGLALVTVLVAGWVGASTLIGDMGRNQGDIVNPAPTPSLTEERFIRQGQLEPGRYSGQVGARRFRLETRNDEWSAVAVHPTWLALAFRQYLLHLQVWGSVVSPRATNANGQQGTPDDVAGWLATHPRLSTSAPAEVTVAGARATQVDVRVIRPLENPPAECTGPCVILGRVAGAGELVDIELGERARFLVIRQAGQQLVVHYRAPERQFAVLDQAVQDLLTGLRFVPSG